jgi:hypothetical protein
MPQDFREMNEWTDEQVAQFKERRRPAAGVRAMAMKGITRPSVLVAEGDSWFDYVPGTDIIDCLRGNHDYEIENYANAGDTLENMIYGTGITRRFERSTPTINAVLRTLGQLKPRAFLFSGGGNDVAGEEFESYLNHADSGLPPLRTTYLNDMVNVVFRKYYVDLIGKVAAVSPDTYIVTHGYGHTVPTGDAVSWWFLTFAGPWLRPALAKKGIMDPIIQRQIVKDVIDTFNTMLADVAQHHKMFRYVDLRGLIDPDTDWANELHLRNSAYARVAQCIHEEIQSLPARTIPRARRLPGAARRAKKP